MDDNQTYDPMGEKIVRIRQTVPLPALYENLAEECAELSKASLKRARMLRGENPTPADPIEVYRNIQEEVVDVVLMLNVLGVSNDDEMMLLKLERWVERTYGQHQKLSNQFDPQEQGLIPEIGDIPEIDLGEEA